MYAEDIEKICGYCVHSKKTEDPFTMLCDKKGEVSFHNACKKFQYDIFKKKIHKKLRINTEEYQEDDFSIE